MRKLKSVKRSIDDANRAVASSEALSHHDTTPVDLSRTRSGENVKSVRFLPPPNSQIVVSALSGDKLTIDPIDLVANSVTSNLYGTDFSAAAIVVLSLLYSDETKAAILADSSWRAQLSRVRSVKDVMSLASQLPPSFQSQLFKLLHNFKNNH